MYWCSINICWINAPTSKLSLSWRSGQEVAVVPVALLQALRASLWGQWGAPWGHLAWPEGLGVLPKGRDMQDEGVGAPRVWEVDSAEAYGESPAETQGQKQMGWPGNFFRLWKCFISCFSSWWHSCIQCWNLSNCTPKTGEFYYT